MTRSTPYRVVTSPKFERPWWAQRMALRMAFAVMWLVGVCGRQGGKSAFGAWLTLKRASLAPNEESMLLVPTFKLADQGALRRTAEIVGALPGANVWHEQKKFYLLWNGHIIWVRSADDPDSVRGPSVTTTLWIDEAAKVSEECYQNALATMVTAESPLVLVTTTPKGKKSWLYKLWTSTDKDVRDNTERFVFRSKDSPVANQIVLRQLGAAMSENSRAQELSGMFLDSDTFPFKDEDLDLLLGERLGPIRGSQPSIGIDLAKETDWTVLTLMNEYGEMWVLDRWQHKKWPATVARIVSYLRKHGALAVVDEGHGGGYGGVIADDLEEELGKHRVERVRTGMQGAKRELIEEYIRDVEFGRLRCDPGAHSAQFRLEHEWFSCKREVVKGVEKISYEGPESEGEHDDHVLAAALANHGRIHGWTHRDVLAGDHGGFGVPLDVAGMSDAQLAQGAYDDFDFGDPI